MTHLKCQKHFQWQMPENKRRGGVVQTFTHGHTDFDSECIISFFSLHKLPATPRNDLATPRGLGLRITDLQHKLWYYNQKEAIPLYRLVNEMSLAKSDV